MATFVGFWCIPGCMPLRCSRWRAHRPWGRSGRAPDRDRWRRDLRRGASMSRRGCASVSRLRLLRGASCCSLRHVPSGARPTGGGGDSGDHHEEQVPGETAGYSGRFFVGGRLVTAVVGGLVIGAARLAGGGAGVRARLVGAGGDTDARGARLAGVTAGATGGAGVCARLVGAGGDTDARGARLAGVTAGAGGGAGVRARLVGAGAGAGSGAGAGGRRIWLTTRGRSARGLSVPARRGGGGGSKTSGGRDATSRWTSPIRDPSAFQSSPGGRPFFTAASMASLA